MSNLNKKNFNSFLQSILLFIVVVVVGIITYIIVIHTDELKATHKEKGTTVIANSTEKKVNAKTNSTNIKNIKKLPIQNVPIQINCKKLKCIALTFDDGPGFYTNKIVKILKKYNAHATFFMIGGAINARGANAKLVVKNGFEIGNHTWDHPDLATLTIKKIKWEINKTDYIFAQKTGVKPSLMRTPYGSINKKVYRTIDKPLIEWNIDSQDWKNRNVAKTYKNVVNNARKNGVVLMHEIYPSTVKALPKILKKLKKRGYWFANISELYKNKLKPHKIYN